MRLLLATLIGIVLALLAVLSFTVYGLQFLLAYSLTWIASFAAYLARLQLKLRSQQPPTKVAV